MKAATALHLLWANLLCATIAQASTTIDFNDGTNGEPIQSFYSVLGVTFSNAEWNNLITGYTPTDPSGLRMVAVGPNFSPKAANPIVIGFTQAAAEVSIVADNVNANGVRIDAYDAIVGGSLVDSQQAVGISGLTNSNANFNLSVSAGSIFRVELYQPFSVESEGVLFDNLSFTFAIPEPGTASMLGGALALVIFLRRRTSVTSSGIDP